VNRRQELRDDVGRLSTSLAEAHQAREIGLAACRVVIRSCGSSIRAVHRHDTAEAEALASAAEAALREAQTALAPFPSVAYAGFLADAEKEYAEARLTAALVDERPLPTADDIGVEPTSWLKGLVEAASELRRHLLDLLRAGDLDRGEELLEVMDDVYDALVGVDFPDAITGGLRRSLDALRAVLERTRGDVTTTVLQTRLRESIDRTLPDA
jgi:translin